MLIILNLALVLGIMPSFEAFSAVQHSHRRLFVQSFGAAAIFGN